VHWRRVHGWRAARWTAGIEATEMETNPRATFLVVLGNVFERLECRSPIFWDVIFFVCLGFRRRLHWQSETPSSHVRTCGIQIFKIVPSSSDIQLLESMNPEE